VKLNEGSTTIVNSIKVIKVNEDNEYDFK